MKPTELTVHQLDVDSIRVFVGRARNREEFDRMKDSIASEGLNIPIQVRDISDLPPKERQRPSGGHYRYELIAGQGRLTAAKELGWRKIPAFVIDAPETEIVGRFLAENMARKSMPWLDKARLVKADLDAGMSREAVAKRYFVTEKHVVRFERILGKISPDVEKEVIGSLTMNDAEILTTLPAEDQAIVVSVLREADAMDGNVAATVAKARAVRAEAGTLSSSALKKTITRVDDEFAKLREQLKVKRLHYALGPQNIETLIAKPEFTKALKSAGVSTERFESLCK